MPDGMNFGKRVDTDITRFLREAKSLIDKPSKWAQKVVYRKRFNLWKMRIDTSFCSFGALSELRYKKYPNDNGFKIFERSMYFLDKCANKVPNKHHDFKYCYHGIIALNDDLQNTSHNDVMKVWDDAIEMSKEYSFELETV